MINFINTGLLFILSSTLASSICDQKFDTILCQIFLSESIKISFDFCVVIYLVCIFYSILYWVFDGSLPSHIYTYMISLLVFHIESRIAS